MYWNYCSASVEVSFEVSVEVAAQWTAEKEAGILLRWKLKTSTFLISACFVFVSLFVAFFTVHLKRETVKKNTKIKNKTKNRFDSKIISSFSLFLFPLLLIACMLILVFVKLRNSEGISRAGYRIIQWNSPKCNLITCYISEIIKSSDDIYEI